VIKPETIKIDDVEYVRKDAASSDGPIKICVLDRGFVYIGNVEMMEGDFIKITNARNIRVWGTTKGLAELVSGPTPKTVMDSG
jgi:hypothetical protein